MKKTQQKDNVRNIRKELISFLSVIIITTLAVTAFSGINMASTALNRDADVFYRKQNFRDLEIASTQLMEEEDLAALAKAKGVADVEGVRAVNGKVAVGDTHKKIQVVSLTERINAVEVLEGRLPETPDECVLEKELTEKLKLTVGDTVTVTDAKEEKPEYLAQNTFLVTGVVYHPDHYALSEQVPGERYLLVRSDAFDTEALSGCWMKAVISTDNTEEGSYFGKKYRNAVQEVSDGLRELNKERAALREQKVNDEYKERLAEAKAELDKGKQELEDGRKELDEKQKELADAEKELAEGKQKLADAEKTAEEEEKKLDAAKKELDEGKQKLEDAEKELNDAYEKLVEGEAALNEAAEQLDEANRRLVEAYNKAEEIKEKVRDYLRMAAEAVAPEIAEQIDWALPSYIADAGDVAVSVRDFIIAKGQSIRLFDDYDETMANALRKVLEGVGMEDRYDSLLEQIKSNEYYERGRQPYTEVAAQLGAWESGQAEYQAGLQEYEKNLAEYEEGRKKQEEGRAEYEEGLATYEDGLAQFEEGQKALAEGKAELEKKAAEYEDGLAALAEGRKKIAEAEAEYQRGLSEYEEGRRDYEEAAEKDPGSCRWVMLNVLGNGSYTHIKDSAFNIWKLSWTFAMLFMVLAALVVYATVGRIITEQRRLVGTQKALGFFGREILNKYLFFGAVGAVLGALLGLVLGELLVQTTILKAHEPFYAQGLAKNVFRGGLAAVIILAAIALATLSVWWACRSLLRQTAKDLMLDAIPAGKKKNAKGKARGSLYSRLILRNMRTDLQRVLITTVSIAGCCVLIVIGFSLRNNIRKSLDVHFNEMLHYKAEVSFDVETAAEAGERIEAILAENDIPRTEIATIIHTLDSPEGLTATELICADADELPDFFELRDPKSGGNIRLPESGVVITKRVSEAYGLSVGDTFTIYDERMNPCEAKVTGIFTYYFGKIMLISKEAYRELFGEDATGNRYWIKTDKSEEELAEMFWDVDGYESVLTTATTEKRFRETTGVLTAITMILILAAGLMAFFVLLNLINMHLNQKKRELTIMRINGFTTGEVIAYVARENILTTLIGIVLGLGIGTFLSYIVIGILQQPQVAIIRGANIPAWLGAAGLTAAFALVINMVALRKVRTLKLNDIA